MVIDWPSGNGNREQERNRGDLGAELRDDVTLGDDGQPTIRGYNESRRLDRAINELMGFLRGILIDGRVDESEIEALGKWLLKNREVQQIWPVNVIAERVSHVLRDGIASEDERDELKLLFENLTGPAPDRFLDSRTATRLPLTEPQPNVAFDGRTFVFTGKFLYGTRKICERAVTGRGGICEPHVTLRTDYLVIGIIGSEDWVYSTHGRKIEQAVEYASERESLSIISEEHWERFVMSTPAHPFAAAIVRDHASDYEECSRRPPRRLREGSYVPRVGDIARINSSVSKYDGVEGEIFSIQEKSRYAVVDMPKGTEVRAEGIERNRIIERMKAREKKRKKPYPRWPKGDPQWFPFEWLTLVAEPSEPIPEELAFALELDD